jgi:phosphoserine phosphatase
MSFTVTLIAAGRLSANHVHEAGKLLLAAGCEPDDYEWIDAGEAALIPCTARIAAARDAVSAMADDIDIVVGHSHKMKLLIADMDSTMITVECIDELADYAGIKPQIAAITERAMRGELDFRAALTERVALLAGMKESVIAECLAERVRLTPGARTLVRTMTAHGARAVLVSGGFTRFAEPVAAMAGFDVAIANVLEIDGGVLTGRVLDPIVDSQTKLATLNAECAALGIHPSAVLAVGDGANDIPMLEAAGLGAAYRGHPKAVAAADCAIRHGDLTALLYAQGYRRRDWCLD